MRATGVIRRIDDLGRIVIPKEIRKFAHITEGDALEIFIGEDNTIILNHYRPEKKQIEDNFQTIIDELFQINEFDLAEETEKLFEKVNKVLSKN